MTANYTTAGEENVQVRDARTAKRFFVDNVIIRGYGPALGVYGVAVYAALCMHANKDTQKCFPAHRKIAEELDCSVAKVKQAIRHLEELKLVAIQARYDPKTERRTSNLYILLEPPGHHIPPGITDTLPSYTEIATNNPHVVQSSEEEAASPPPSGVLPGDDVLLEEDSLWPDDVAAIGEEVPRDDPVAAFKARHNPVEVMAGIEAERKRAEVKHPDFADPTHDADPWDVAVDAFCKQFWPGVMPGLLSEKDRKNYRKKIRSLTIEALNGKASPERAVQVMESFAAMEPWLVKPSTTPYKTSWEQGFKVMLVMDPRAVQAQLKGSGGPSTPRQQPVKVKVAEGAWLEGVA